MAEIRTVLANLIILDDGFSIVLILKQVLVKHKFFMLSRRF